MTSKLQGLVEVKTAPIKVFRLPTDQHIWNNIIIRNNKITRKK